MDYSWIWKAVIIVFVGTTLLRFAGRKSIAQMTTSQTVIMIAIGTLLIQPISGRNIWVTFLTAGLLVTTLFVLEYTQLKFNFAEKLLTGKSKVIIENGILNEKNLSKLRLTVDQLEMQLRQQSVNRIGDVKWATIEPNGRIAVLLMEKAQPATKGDILNLITLINTKIPIIPNNYQPSQTKDIQDLFSEIVEKDGTTTITDRLQ
ncbi:MAG: hypothetical protein VR72_03500 [Clostridiaceae bacterium BRH_c20a]|nr:MAG: hypothetical protein VR72_03500 [Clostridiaceae bacterium BRH_c20a]